MLSKDVTTVRVSNLHNDVSNADLYTFFQGYDLEPISPSSLCPCPTSNDATQVATVTFKSASEAKKALALRGKTVRGSNIEIERDFMGLTILAEPKQPTMDIIAIHGLNGHAFGTWCSRETGSSNGEAMWLRDFLPEKVNGARVMVYGYNSILLGPNTSVSVVSDFASDLLQRVMDDRVYGKNKHRPLILICHSLGGIVAKQAVVLSHTYRDRYAGIHDIIHSILFLATPHGGSKSANLGSILSSAASLAFQRPSKQLLNTLKLDSRVLFELSVEFRVCHSPIKIVNFYERRKTPILNSLVVDEISSKLGIANEVLIPIDATHSSICKFRSSSDANFLPVLAQIKQCCQEAMSSFTQDTSISLSSDFAEDSSMISHSTMSTASIGKFLVPVSKNPHFYGRQVELQLLEKHLKVFDQTASSDYPIVAIRGLGGVGYSIGSKDISLNLSLTASTFRKTQLVTQYAYNHRKNNPHASVIWISAKSEDEIDAQFRQVGKRLSSSDSSYEENVRNWMFSPDHKDWLLILDDFCYTDVEIRRFLPTEAAGSVLITTRDRRVFGSIASFSIDLTAMNNTDAESLFLRIRGSRSDNSWKHPPVHPEYLALQQIVRELHCFPLAIDQAVAFIRENSPMTLQEYLSFLKPRSRDRELLMRFKEANPSYAESVMTTWEISLQYLERKHSRASWILQLLGFFDNSLITENLLTGATKPTLWTFASTFYERQLPVRFLSDMDYLKDDVGFRIAIGQLTSLSLVERKLDSTFGRVLNLHPLVHEWIRVRLNPDPFQQASLTITASLVMYQTLPMEMIFGLYDDPPIYPKSLMTKYDAALRHLDSLLLNLTDYCCHSREIPLECFTLCEAFFFSGYNERFAHSREISKTMLHKLDRVVRLIASRLPPGVKSLALFIHNVNVWLRSERQPGKAFHTVSKISRSIKSLSLTIEVDDSVAMFLMMLITTCTNVVETVDATSLPSNIVKPSVTILSHGNHSQTIVGCQETKSLFHNLHRLLWDHSIRTLLVQRIALFVKCRLLRLLSPAEYTSYNDLDIAQDLSSEALEHLSISQKGSTLCLFAAYLWENDQHRNWPALKTIFSLILTEWKNKLKETKLGTRVKHDHEVLETWYQFGHIHSDPGGMHGTDSTDASSSSGEVLTSPLDYIWSITLAVAEAVSSPEERWKISEGGGQDHEVLNRLDREYAVRLVVGMESIYWQIMASAPLKDRKIRQHFQEWDVKLTLIRIYRNLSNWLGLQNMIWDALKCGVLLGSEQPLPRIVGGDSNFNLGSSVIALQFTPSELDIALNHQHSRSLDPRHATGEQPENLYTPGPPAEDMISRFPDAFKYADSNAIEEVIAAFILLYENRAPVRSTGFTIDDEYQQRAVEVNGFRATLANIESMPTGAARTVERMILIHRLSKEYFTSLLASNRNEVDTRHISFGSTASITVGTSPPSSSTGLDNDDSDNDMIFEIDFD